MEIRRRPRAAGAFAAFVLFLYCCAKRRAAVFLRFSSLCGVWANRGGRARFTPLYKKLRLFSDRAGFLELERDGGNYVRVHGAGRARADGDTAHT